MDNFRNFMWQQPQQPQQPAQKIQKWNASKEEIINYWKSLRTNTPIVMQPIEHNHKGSTYGEDGIRITGSPQFISTVLARLKEFLLFENPSTKLAIAYRQTKSPSRMAMGENKTSYVFYLQSKKRNLKQ